MNQDLSITTLDYVGWHNRAFAGATGYDRHDLDFDGNVDIRDYTLWWQNARLGVETAPR